MEDIRFVREIMGTEGKYADLGNCRYYKLNNGNRAKVTVDGGGMSGESHGMMCYIIDKKDGEVDRCYFPFRNYFAPTKCCESGPYWYQHVDRGSWYFSHMKHTLPTEKDFEAIREAIFLYMDMFS